MVPKTSGGRVSPTEPVSMITGRLPPHPSQRQIAGRKRREVNVRQRHAMPTVQRWRAAQPRRPRGPYGRIPEHAEAAQRERVELEQVHALRRGKLLQPCKPLVEECEGAEANHRMRRRTSAYAFIQTAVACVREHMCARLRERRTTHKSACVRAAAAAHSGRARASLRDGRRCGSDWIGRRVRPALAPTKQRGGCHRGTWSMRGPRGSGRALRPTQPQTLLCND